MEIWKQYRDTDYEVSDLGNVRNKKTGLIRKSYKKYNGKYENDYLKVDIYYKGKRQKKAVHRLVAECFLEDYNECLEVNHKNSNRTDNRVENLEMTTKEENYLHSIINGNGSQRKPVYCLDLNNNRLDFISLWGAARFIKDKYNKNVKIDHICNNINNNLKGKCKTAYGYQWFNMV